MGTHAKACTPSLVWLGKPLKYYNFGVCSLIELEFTVNDFSNFLQWNFRLSCAQSWISTNTLPGLTG